LGRKEKQIMKSKIVIVLLLTFVTATAAFAIPPNGEKPEKSLIGTWVTTVSPPPEAEVPPFKLIFSFLSDHNLIATGTGGELPALGNPCLGTWAKSDGNNEYTITYVCLDFDATLQVTGMDKLTGLVTPNASGGTLSGSIALTNFDPDGHEVFTACCASIDGGRLEVESFSKVSGSLWRAPKLRK
jgi:hypothetical protein